MKTVQMLRRGTLHSSPWIDSPLAYQGWMREAEGPGAVRPRLQVVIASRRPIPVLWNLIWTHWLYMPFLAAKL